MSELSYSPFARALEAPLRYTGDAPAGRRTDLPRWLVDHDFDATMAAMYPDADNAPELLPRRQRLGLVLVLAILAWAPIVLAGVLLWN